MAYLSSKKIEVENKEKEQYFKMVFSANMFSSCNKWCLILKLSK